MSEDKNTVSKPKPEEMVANLDDKLMARVQQSFPLDTYEFQGDAMTQAKKRLALQGYAMRGIISNACWRVGIARKTWYRWIDEDPEFARAAADGRDFAMESLEAMAFDRGLVISDALLQFMLKHGKPQVFRDKVEHSGPNGQALPGNTTNVLIASPVLIMPDNQRGDAPVSLPPPAEQNP